MIKTYKRIYLMIKKYILKKRIEKYKLSINKSIEENYGNLLSDDVLKKSRILDKLINEFIIISLKK